MSSNIVQRIAMKAVIVRDGKVLIIREKKYVDGTNVGRYGFPGGRIELGEPWKDGLTREIREEVGLENVRIVRPLFVGEWFPTIREIPHQIVAMFHVCESSAGDVMLGDEHDEYQWVDAESWQTLTIMKPDDEVLMAYFASR